MGRAHVLFGVESRNDVSALSRSAGMRRAFARPGKTFSRGVVLVHSGAANSRVVDAQSVRKGKPRRLRGHFAEPGTEFIEFYLCY